MQKTQSNIRTIRLQTLHVAGWFTLWVCICILRTPHCQMQSTAGWEWSRLRTWSGLEYMFNTLPFVWSFSYWIKSCVHPDLYSCC